MWRRACSLGCVVVLASCSTKAPPAAGGTHALVVKTATPAADAAERVAALIPGRNGSCAQVKSMKEQAEAQSVADAIKAKLQLPVDVVRADLGERGVWWRICVGDEDSESRLVARATKWTGPGGDLEPFLDAAKDNAPRFFVLNREQHDAKPKATPQQAQALSSFALVDGAAVVPFGTPGALVVAATAATESGTSDVVAVDAAGKRALFDEHAAPGCASCELALKESPVKARRAMSAGDVAAAPGDELLVEELTDKGVRVLSVVALESGALKRVASLVLENARPGFASTGTAAVVEADTDSQKEIVLASTELLTEGDAACSVEHHAALYDLQQGKGLVRIDPLKLPPDPADAVINVITALDAWGDHDAGSRACAAQLARDPRAPTAQLCVQRVRRLLDQGALVDAVNAAGLVAEGSASLRPIVAAPFQEAAAALDRDPRLFVGEADCAKSPLVDKLGARPLDQTMKLALAKAQERVPLADVADAVFVTGSRDFGDDSPVGAITARWLEKAKVALPARYAAVEALLLPQAPDAAVDAGAP